MRVTRRRLIEGPALGAAAVLPGTCDGGDDNEAGDLALALDERRGTNPQAGS